MSRLEAYFKQFTQLNRASNSVFGEGSKRRAPHKPILLLSVLAWYTAESLSRRSYR
jgi:putative restriction endonuclease